jgi:hypothetical protein
MSINDNSPNRRARSIFYGIELNVSKNYLRQGEKYGSIGRNEEALRCKGGSKSA